MQNPLRDLSPPALVEAIEENLYAYYAWFASFRPGGFLREPGSIRFVTGIPSPWFNGVGRSRLAPDDAPAVIERTLAHFAACDLPLIWWIDTGTRPPDLVARLEALGLRPQFLPGMAADLHALDESAGYVPALRIERVRDEEGLRDWMQASSAGFGRSEAVAAALHALLRRAGFGEGSPSRLYVGYRDGRPVGASQLFLAAGVAGIHNVATVPEARRQGIGGAMTLAPLLDAREAGYRVGILHALPMGFNVYRKLGFDVYCELGACLWEPARLALSQGETELAAPTATYSVLANRS